MAQEAFDLAEQFQTPVFVMMDLDLGMNNWMSDGVQVSRQADQPRQAADGGEAEGARRVGPLQGRGRRRHSVPHDSGRRHAGRTSRAAPATTRRASTASGPTTTSRTWIGWRASSRRRGSSCRSRWSTAMPKAKIGFIALRHVALGDRGEPRSAARGDRRRRPRTSGCARIRSTRSSRRSSTRTSASTSSSRTATRSCCS